MIFRGDFEVSWLHHASCGKNMQMCHGHCRIEPVELGIYGMLMRQEWDSQLDSRVGLQTHTGPYENGSDFATTWLVGWWYMKTYECGSGQPLISHSQFQSLIEFGCHYQLACWLHGCAFMQSYNIFTPLRVGWPPTPQVYFGSSHR